MSFSFALLRAIILFVIVLTNVTLSVLAAVAFHKKTEGAFQVLAMCFSVCTFLAMFGCYCHQLVNRNEGVSNARNLGLFACCGLLGSALVTSLMVHAQQDDGVALCNDSASVTSPCVPAGVQLGMAYLSLVFALISFVISWIDQLPGAVKVMSRYPITKAPGSHFAAYGHDLDWDYTYPPVKTSSRSQNNSGWNDVHLKC